MNIKSSLILTVFNEEETIAVFLQSLLAQTTFPDEIIILDGGSSDRTCEIIEKALSVLDNLKFKIIIDPTCNKNHSLGPIAKGRNIAIQESKNEYILATDAGCILSKDWVERMQEYFEKGYDVVAGVYTAQVDNKLQKSLAKLFIPNFKKYKYFKDFFPSSRSFGFKKSLWLAAGGYPENSYTAEDTKFVKNIYKLTNNGVIALDASVEWEIPKTYLELAVKCEQYGIGDAVQHLDLFKYFLRFSLLLFLPISIVVFLLLNKPLISFYMYYYQVKGYLKGLF